MKKIFATLALVLLGSTAFAGARGGSQIAREAVNANAVDRYQIVFNGGEIAQVIVEGDGDTDLDLYVYDEKGRLVAEDIDNSDLCVCRWKPHRTGYFTIRIVNLGSVYNEYTMLTN